MGVGMDILNRVKVQRIKPMHSGIFAVVTLVAVLLFVPGSEAYSAAAGTQVPAPEVQDLITHDKGNIRTTVSNWGTIGGLSHLGFPSGEWPKGSGHDYLAELKFWMGAVVVSGDTLLADSDDDYAPLTSYATATDYRIRLSTDTTRYEYDPSDTIGAGRDNPANGWRRYDPQTGQWVYNEVWDPITQSFYNGGPSSLQESIYRFNDAGLGSSLLGLEMVQTIYQWNYNYNEDVMFVVLDITNKSANNYENFAFGLYCDFDIGGPDGTGENGRLGDLVASDTSQNLAWTYDADGYDPGWGASVVTGIMGTRYIETPDNIGMTAFRTGEWERIANTNDREKYAYITENVFEETLPPTDQYYVQATSGISLESGKTIRIGFAIIAGHDEEDFRNKSKIAQTVYSNHFVGPTPPKPSKLTVLAGNREARLSWDNAAPESVDPLLGTPDFAGYKIYRSSDQGASWGRLVRNNDGSLGPDYVPLAIWRVEDPSEPIPHTYVDTALVNGYEYWYSVVAFDKGDSIAGVGPLQTAYGRPGRDVNAGAATPRSNPAGYVPVESTLRHLVDGAATASAGDVIPVLFDDSQFSGEQYEVGFKEDMYSTTWYVLNRTTGDTLANDLTDQTGDPAQAPIVDGVQIYVYNGDREPTHYRQVSFTSGTDTTLELGYSYGPMGDAFGFPIGGDINFRSTYQLRFTASGSVGYSFYDDVTPINLPFEVWNTTTDQQVIAEIYHLDSENPGWDPRNRDYISILNVPYDDQSHPEAFPYGHVWFFRLDTASYNYNVGDVFEIGGAPVNGADDKFVFDVPSVNKEAAAAALDRVRVVPNPYIARAAWETVEGERRLEFVNLPATATIRVYTLAGDLVQTLEHDGSGTYVWNMLTSNGQGIAPGLYFYHVESEVGERVGKFAVIK